MSAPVSLWVRADWRRRYLSLIGLSVVAGISFAIAITAFAGARRTATSFDRLLAETHAYDGGIVIDSPGDGTYDAATVDRLRRLKEVDTAGEVVFYVASVPKADWEVSLFAPADAAIGTTIATERVLRGRMPAADRVDEVAVNEAAVAQGHVDVGSVLTLQTLTPEQRLRIMAGDGHAVDDGLLGPELRLHVVGVTRGPSDVVGRSDPSAFATPAFDRMYRGNAAYSQRVLLVKRAAGFTAQQLDDAVGQVISGFRLGVFDAAVENAPAERTTHTLANGLWVFALVAGLVSVLVANQAVARHVAGADSDHPALTALGFTRAQRMLGAMATVVPAAVPAAILAVLASYVASPLMPVGMARRVEPDPGLRFDPLAAGLGALFVIATILLTAAIAAAAATRRPTTSRATPTRVPRAAAVTPAGLGPVASTGIRLAFDRRSPALPVRSTILAVAAALAVLVGALTFAASLHHLEASPERWGYGWDLMLDTTPDQADAFVTDLTADRALDGVSLLRRNFTYMHAGGRTDGMQAYGIESRSGHVGYALLSGSQPVGVDEVVIGPATARSRGLGIGSMLGVQTCPCTGDQAEPAMQQVRVVGISLFPEDDNGNFNDALGFSERGYAAHVDMTADLHAIVSTAPGTDVDEVAHDLAVSFPDAVSAYSIPSRPGEVGTLASLRAFPTALAAVAALLGSAVLLNMLVATRTRRRRELATLWSLGLTSRELRGCVAWQSAGIVGIALVLGTVAGLAAGGAVWIAATNGIGVATDVSRPLATIGLWSCVALLTAVVLGSLSGSRLADIHLAGSLRQE